MEPGTENFTLCGVHWRPVDGLQQVKHVQQRSRDSSSARSDVKPLFQPLNSLLQEQSSNQHSEELPTESGELVDAAACS